MIRLNERSMDELREINITPDYLIHPEGSVLIAMGKTKVICTATVEEKVPPFMKGENKGWVTAEYSMLPRATGMRTVRESTRGKVGGRTMEIQRLIGRSLRSVIDLSLLGERTVLVDCDVIQADGGTRTASITGAYVACVLAFGKLKLEKKIEKLPVTDFLAATSVGKVEGQLLLDLCYQEDSKAEVDMNLVMTGKGSLVEIQGTGEESTFTRAELEEMILLGEKGIQQLIQAQKIALGSLAGMVGV